MLELVQTIPAHNKIVVLSHHNLLFCPIPKVACTNWKMTLRHAEGYTGNDESIVHDRRRNGLTYLSTQSPFRRFSLLTQPDVTRAVFVRNPWTRILSAYRSKLEGKRPSDVADDLRKRWLLHVLTSVRNDGKPISFAEFIAFLEATQRKRMNSHWRPQSLLAGIGVIRYNFIGRFEQLEQDIETLNRRCKLPSFYRGGAAFVTHSSERDTLERYFTPELIQRVGRIYADDIRRLGYSCPI
jgi:hypothetical protein